VPLKRIFLLGAATLASVAALGAIVAVLNGDFGETEGDFFATLATAFVAGSTALAAIACLARGSRFYGFAGTVLSSAGFLLWTEQIWADHDSQAYWQFLGLVLIWTLVLLASASSALMTRTRHVLHRLTGIAACAAGLTVSGMVLRENGDAWQLFAVLLILTILGLILTPILERYSTADGPRERELGTIDGVTVVAQSGNKDNGVRIGDRIVPLARDEIVILRGR
jgi:hypothetical protein